MFFGKSITFDEKELGGVALADRPGVSSSRFEAEFIEKLKSGDAESFDKLVSLYARDVYALLLRTTKDAREAEDLTQETFLRALRGIGKFRGEAGLKTWLFRIAINQSRNRFRWWKRRRREKTVSLDAPASDGRTPLSETFSGNLRTPEEDVLQREQIDRLQKALGDLPAIFREAVVLCDIEGFSYEEIADILRIKIGTVKSRIARGRVELRKKLDDI